MGRRARGEGASSGAALDALARWLSRPVDAASLVAFRVTFGLTLALGLVRFLAQGWVRIVYEEPTFFFKYPGFEWVTAPPGPWMHGLLVLLALAAVCVALGLFYRASVAVFFFGFTYLQLIDLTNYLNHYYLVVVLAGLMTLMPLGRAGSLDVRLRGAPRVDTFPAWMLLVLRFQVALVYVFAAWAKTGEDWLLHAQPLGIWMAARVDTPLVGPLLARPEAAYLMAWGGLAYDATIVGFLLWPRTRLLAYIAVLGFHALTQVFFDIGMFPTIMVTSTLLFFSPSWPRRLLARLGPAPSSAAAAPVRSLPRPALALLGGWMLLQLLLPLRHHALPGDVLWGEEGMRFAWKVMVREKNGSVTYRVRSKASGREWQVDPRRYLTPRQAAEMATQPDMIAQLARHVRADFARRGLGDVEVRAETLVSLNGRPARPLVDPRVDLAAVEVGLGPSPWILPGPEGPPLRVLLVNR